ncbi:MAG: hypothetical protein NT013_07085 [Planctomycetia bacterium]|nr:hypothetical protein [Planctomycetia bacterium]
MTLEPPIENGQTADESVTTKPALPTGVGCWVRLWFGFHDPVDHIVYAKSGFGLMLLKYVVEMLVVFAVSGLFYSPLSFLLPLNATRGDIYQALPSWLVVVYLLWTLPFQWIAVSMSIRRAAHRGEAPWNGLIVLLPMVNLIAMLWWCFPNRTRAVPLLKAPPQSSAKSALFVELSALLAGVGTFLMMMGLSVYGFHEYGAVLFFATPVMVGAVSAYVLNVRAWRSVSATIGFVVWCLMVCGLVLLAFAMEGGICILMAAPIFLVEAMFGALVGKLIAELVHVHTEDLLGAIAILPILAGIETFQPPPPVREVVSIVEIAAPPETVWRNVVSFPDLPPPQEWFFRAGIACPERARIEGNGVGATRYCEFSTGSFVEPIRVWEEPRHLAFDVTKQPPTMRELSPWGDIHPPHLDFVLRSRRGEFRLIPLANGGTRLEGRTWYDFKMGPQLYWSLWGDYFIHRIHLRVLEHIQQLSEAKPADTR